MVGTFVLYILFMITIVLQVVIIRLLSNKLNSIEELIKTNKMETKEVKDLNMIVEPKLETTIPVPDNEEVLFIKEIKLGRGSNQIDMDVQMNNRNK
ncbi:MAG: hypothetical protein GX231_02010 [Tissierellia bacterium]|nr:hypothetical protein [Tissierellia bacterium]